MQLCVRVVRKCVQPCVNFFLTGNVLQIQPSQALVLVVTLVIWHVQALMRKTKYQLEPYVRDVPKSCVEDEVEEEECTRA